MEVKKFGITMQVNSEFFEAVTGRPQQGIKSTTWVPVDEEELLAFRKWKKAFKKLRKEGYAKGWYQDGGPDYGPELIEPTGHWEYEYEDASG